ncbi:MAG: YraN family protein [Porticoccaceae bacterium]|nr:YraN family protein [Porticoccaceae bacterium]
MDFNDRHSRKETSLKIGAETEQFAHDYLLANGLIPVNRNFNTLRGEIDIIMQDKEQLVFVEVRFRKSSRFGSAEESITQQKRKKIKAAAAIYMQSYKMSNNTQARFDVVALTGDSRSSSQFSVNWIKNIFIE